ncbi:MAG: VOC family protein [Thermoleophilia bacterium]|nr:VOC family protein [Thermoleophilia bacterium]
MAIKRMDHVGIVVEDIAAATSFFVELGMQVGGEGAVEGAWVGRVVGLEGVRSHIAMLKTPDGASCIELSCFDTPAGPSGHGDEPSNAPGLRHLCFNVDNLEATVERLRAHGAELVGSIENYEDAYLLCYLRGPEGIIVELAQDLG